MSNEGNDQIGPVLITGGNGFLGRALSKLLTESGESVVSLDLTPSGSLVEGVHFEAGNINDIDALTAISQKHQIRAIVHLAALVIPACKADPVLGAEVNIIGHLNMLEIARRLNVRRFVYTSSVAARPRGELESPVNLYGAYKRCCEDISKIWFLEYGIPSIGLRPNVVYGPGREQGETAAITLAIKAAAKGESYHMPFAGSMCFQYLDEVVDVIARCLRATPKAPLVSDVTDQIQSIDEVLAAINSIDPEAKIFASDNMRAAPPELDNSPLRNLLGNWPAIGLEAGVRRTYDFYSKDQSTI